MTFFVVLGLVLLFVGVLGGLTVSEFWGCAVLVVSGFGLWCLGCYAAVSCGFWFQADFLVWT